jgi:hypothetical protein
MGQSKDSPGWYANGCTGDFDWDGVADETFICASGMDLVATTDSSSPLIERYLLNTIGIIGIYFNGDGVSVGDGKVMGGYTRRYYEPAFNPASLPTTDVFTPTTPLRLFTLNADNTLNLESYYGDSGKPGYLNISNFERTAVGISNSGLFTNENNTSGSYTAVRLD